MAPRGDEVIQVATGLWRMDVGPTSPAGVLFDFSLGEETERWMIDLAQSRALVHVLRRLVRVADLAGHRAP